MMIDIDPVADSRQTPTFEELYRDHLAMVYRYTTARLGRSDGEDATADVFHAAAVAFADGREATVTPAWLMAVAHNKVVDRWRRAERRAARAHLLLVRGDELAITPFEHREPGVRAEVLRILGRLKTNHRALLLLHHVDGMSVPDIAAAAEQSVAAVESTLARARRAFRREYDEEVGA